MKKFLLFIICASMVHMSHGQPADLNASRYSFGISFDILDQHTPDVDGLQLFKAPMDFGMRLYTWINANSSVAIQIGVGTSALRKADAVAPYETKNLHMFNGDVGFIYKFNNGYILKESSPVGPYLFAKARGSYLDLKKSLLGGQRWGLGIPVGGGINWRVGDGVALQTEVAYTFGVTDGYDNDLVYSLGLLFNVGHTNKVPVIVEPEPEPILDTDNDGIVDPEDDCPTVAGLAEFNGCPDTDADGIIDSQDDCPETAGLAEFGGCPDTDGDGIRDIDDDCPEVPGLERLRGCPNPDGDGDGIPDDSDDCPTVPGLATLNGCPDADGDGVTDAKDKCPTEAGPASNKGCPEVKEEVIKRLEFAATAIQFETGSAVIKTSSFKILDEVVAILKEWKNYSVSVAGHTDSVGSESSNLTLSEKRAQAAAAYLVSKGIDSGRVSSAGFGESQPKGDNSTAAGRAQNRRVEFNLFIP